MDSRELTRRSRFNHMWYAVVGAAAGPAAYAAMDALVEDLAARGKAVHEGFRSIFEVTGFEEKQFEGIQVTPRITLKHTGIAGKLLEVTITRGTPINADRSIVTTFCEERQWVASEEFDKSFMASIGAGVQDEARRRERIIDTDVIRQRHDVLGEGRSEISQAIIFDRADRNIYDAKATQVLIWEGLHNVALNPDFAANVAALREST